MTKAELSDHVRAIQRAVEAELPEDEHDDVRPWVYRKAVEVMAERLYPSAWVAALDEIATYDRPEHIRRTCEKQFGLSYEEALEFAYENVLGTARHALRHLPRPKRRRKQQPKPAAVDPHVSAEGAADSGKPSTRVGESS